MVKKKSQTFRQFSSMMTFVTIAALLWLLIKLSANYTVTEPLTIDMGNSPANLVLSNGTQEINITLSTSGFELLHYYFKPVSRRKVDISLEEVPLHKDSEDTYSFGSNYIKDKIANFLKIEPNEVSFDENRIIINMEPLDSVKVKVIPNVDITYEKQYNSTCTAIKCRPEHALEQCRTSVAGKLHSVFTGIAFWSKKNCCNSFVNISFGIKNPAVSAGISFKRRKFLSSLKRSEHFFANGNSVLSGNSDNSKSGSRKRC